MRQLICAGSILLAADQAAYFLQRSTLLGTDPVFVTIGKGGVPWSDMLRSRLQNMYSHNVTIEARSYVGTKSSGEVVLSISDEVKHEVRMAIGRSIVIVDDVIETGKTLDAVIDWLIGLGHSDSKIVVSAAIVKRRYHRAKVTLMSHMTSSTKYDVPTAVGFEVDVSQFVIGFGMDHNGRFRELDHICVLDNSDIPKTGGSNEL